MNTRPWCCLVAVWVALLIGHASGNETGETGVQRIYVGTFMDTGSKGIYLVEQNSATGELELMGVAAEADRPGFLAVHPNGRFLYSVTAGKSFRSEPAGGVAAFAVERGDGSLRFLNEVSSRGRGPCHLSVDPSGATLLAANYGGGNVASFRVGPDGSISDAVSVIDHERGSGATPRQRGPHAHSIYPSPCGRFALSADLGADEIRVYRLDAERSKLEPAGVTSLPPGAGPRHLAFHRSGDRLFCLNELDGTLTLFSWDGKTGELERLRTVTTLPEEFEGDNTTAEVVVHPTGRFVYASNRGHDSIAAFRYERDGDRLQALGHEPTRGGHPRNFNIDPTGRWLIVANRDGGNLVVLEIDPETGTLAFSGHVLAVPQPVCVTFWNGVAD